jgi:hypothetical protein
LDFTTNYLVIGEIATAAGLSAYNLIAGPLFYLTHEAAVWNYWGPADDAVSLPGLTEGSTEADGEPGGLSRFTNQPCARQDPHLPRHRFDDGLRDQLRRGA